MTTLDTLYIDGAFVAGSGAPFDVVDPATEDVITSINAATPGDVEAALRSAAAGFAVWKATDPWTRSARLREVARLLRERADEIAASLTAEQGKPLAQARLEVLSGADQFDWHADEARRLYGRVVESRNPTDRITVRREPVGVIAAFTPWNFPVLLPARKISAALAAGCAIVLKPAEETPLTGLHLANACHDAGIPAGVVNVLFGAPAAISEQLIASDVVRKVTLTGSVPVGVQLMTLAARGVKPISLELGGHAPVVVFDDVDVDKAAVMCADAKFRNAGQVCIAATRFIVQDSMVADFSAAFVRRTSELRVGYGTDPTSDIGPLTNARRVDMVEHLVADAVERGAELLAGGCRPTKFAKGHWYEPTVLGGVTPDAELLRTEPFGPVAPILPFASFDEAITLANSTPYGLAGYVLTNDAARGMLASEALECGMVGVNNFALATAEAPFGGVKSSGFGREGGSEGILDYTHTKYVNVRLDTSSIVTGTA